MIVEEKDYQMITYQNLTVEGTPIKKITAIKISNLLNDYGSAYIEGEVETSEGISFTEKLTTGTVIKIKTTASNQWPTLFVGIVTNAGVETQAEYSLLKLHLRSTAFALNLTRECESFQRTSEKYEDIMKKALDGDADLDVKIPDEQIGALIVRYNETAWDFCKRMASVFRAPLSSNIESEKPKLTVGVPDTGKQHEIKKATIGYRAQTDRNYGGRTIVIDKYMYIGDKVSLNGETMTVQAIESNMVKGVLITEVCFLDEKICQDITSGKNESIVQPKITNQAIAGKMLVGTVKEVEKDKVKVHLTTIDESYDGGGDFQFPYSTVYSSNDGSGFYCMPGEEDTVRIFFPTDVEGDAFAASSVNVSPLSDPLHKKWRSPAGKEILLTPEGLLISCKDEKIFIDLTDSQGIKIMSEKDIVLNAMKNLTVYAKKNLKMQAEDRVLISSGESYIDISSDLIEMGAKQIMIK